MKIVVVNGTEVKGCTHHIKEAFLGPLRSNHEIAEFFLPGDMPNACTGCKACFFSGVEFCPHSSRVEPIWSALLSADLLVFAAPVYGLGIPGGLKALLDHFTVRWMVHRPEPAMFSKHAVVMTNCIGMSFMARSAQRDIVNALSWLGVSKIARFSVGLMEGVIWEELSLKRRARIEEKARHLACRYDGIRPPRKSLRTRVKFLLCTVMHRIVLKGEATPSADSRHWLERGWM